MMSLDEPRKGRRRFLGDAMRTGAVGALGALLAACTTSEEEMERELRVAGAPTDFPGLDRAYGLDSSVLYLNHASIGTIPKVVQAAHVRYLKVCEKNPWLYMWGGAWEAPRERVRQEASKLLGCTPEELALTHNTTEAFNLLARGLPLKRGDEVLFSSLNHPGASICFERFAALRGYKVRRFPLPLRELTTITAEEVVERHLREIREETRLLVFPHVDNVVGLRHPVAALAAGAHRQGVEFVAVDGAQSAGMLPLYLEHLDVDFYATSAHKWLQAPKGTGLFYARKKLQPQVLPLWVTWGQEEWGGSARRFEDYGTRNLPEVLALGDAVRFQDLLGAARKEQRLKLLWNHLRDQLAGDPMLDLASPSPPELVSSITSVVVPVTKPGPLAQQLFQRDGVVVRPFRREGLSLLRISPNVITRRKELDRLLELLGARLA